jgi:Uma2 family endonuclease
VRIRGQGAPPRAMRYASRMDDVLATVDVRRRRFTVEEYYRMAEVGILGPSDRVELIEGEIVEMAPIGLRHALCVALLTGRLVKAIGDRALLWPQNPVRLFPDSEPRPDIALIGPAWQRESHPGPRDVALVVEVADTTYRYDRYVKVPLYARSGVAEVWVVDLTRDVVEAFRNPSATGYASEQRIERGRTVAPVAFPDVVLSVADILPPA